MWNNWKKNMFSGSFNFLFSSIIREDIIREIRFNCEKKRKKNNNCYTLKLKENPILVKSQVSFVL